MYSLHGPLEALLTPDDGPIGTPHAAAPLPHLNPVVWISFSGDRNESVTLFIQSVQRVAFQHNRIEDDKWIAQLASTCFTDTALVWYFGLEEDTQTSWAKLRIALVQHYMAQGGSQTPKPGRPGVTVPAQPKPSRKETSITAPKLTDIGIVEVLLPVFGDVLGYLSQDPMGKFVIEPDSEKALKLQKVLHTDSDKPDKKIYSLRLLDAPDPRFPFLGLKLLKFPGEDPNHLPNLNSSTGLNHTPDIPACCKIPKPTSQRQIPSHWNRPISTDLDESGPKVAVAYATWEFVQSTESGFGRYYIRKAEGPDPKTRVVSAVWTIFDPVKHVSGLGLIWPHGNGRNAIDSEITLQPVVHKGGIVGLHVHANEHESPLPFHPHESRVVLVFKQVSSPGNPA